MGGDVAGSVVAARLSEDPRRRVLLLEAGEEPTHEVIYSSTGIMSLPTEANWANVSLPHEALGGRTVEHSRGRVLGGSAAINVGS